jgi:hypothetical protein
MTKAQGLYDRYFAGDEEALTDAVEEAAAVYVNGELSTLENVGEALASHESVKLLFSDLSFLELVPLARDGLWVGFGPTESEGDDRSSGGNGPPLS